jgi:hypothetical protein
MYEVTKYEHPHIFVRSHRTHETYKLLVGSDGALAHDEPRSDLEDARRTAIFYLAGRARANAILKRT